MDSDLRSPAIEVYGRDGTIQMLGDDWDPKGYELKAKGATAWQIFDGSHALDEEEGEWAWMDGLRHLVDCIRAGRRPLITPEHAYHVMEIMTTMELVARDGHARELTSSFAPLDFAADEGATTA